LTEWFQRTPDVTLTNEGADQIVDGIAVPQAW
jgi:hypothetical protein